MCSSCGGLINDTLLAIHHKTLMSQNRCQECIIFSCKEIWHHNITPRIISYTVAAEIWMLMLIARFIHKTLGVKRLDFADPGFL